MRGPVAVLLASGCLATAAPVPKHLMKTPEPVEYFPTAVGAKWEYEGGHVLVVTKVEARGGKKVVTVGPEGGKGIGSEVAEVSAAGLTRLGFGGPAWETPLVLLKAPYREGTTWENKTPGAEGTATIGAVETLEVPAGTFEVVRVDTVQDRGGGKVRTIRGWYAPRVGLVKMTDDDRVIWLLKSFTPAGPAGGGR